VIDGGLRRDPGSWRDPYGFVYRRDGVLLRQINRVAEADWAAARETGLLGSLQAAGLLIGHEPAPLDWAADASIAIDVIRPELVPFVSYPYEWTFGQLKAAALLTLRVQGEAMSRGLELRDASAYNVQFIGSEPIFIDTLSFRRAATGAPWIAYRQFCEHLLAPLSLMARRDVRLGGLLRDHLDGVPLDLAASLLPGRTRLSLGLGSHIHLHARSQQRHASRPQAGAEVAATTMSPTRQAALHDSLVRLIEHLDWTPAGTEWADYGTESSYDDPDAQAKDQLIARVLAEASPAVVWDLGANNGRYSAIAARTAPRVVALDIDPAASERHWRELKARNEARILPLLQDLANPSPAIGWDAHERLSLFDRAEGATLLALALVHHLAIGRNVPLPMLSATLARLGERLVIEWVPKEDPMVRRLLSTREDVFPSYTAEGFEEALSAHWRVQRSSRVGGTSRMLYEATRR
jgi:SAM-dependent methyltransferase